jgi:hypothetical protein
VLVKLTIAWGNSFRKKQAIKCQEGYNAHGRSDSRDRLYHGANEPVVKLGSDYG